MYGLINRALKDMVTEKFGVETWNAVLRESGVPEDSFLTMRSYDDAITYALAGAASKVLETPVEGCLELFGEYWLLESAPRSYGMLLDAAGENMVEFLQNLNAMHDRITSTFLNYRPPSFSVDKLDGDRFLVHYQSEREGLSPFVRGLLTGMGKRFGHGVIIHSTKEMELAGGAQTIFEIEIVPS